MQQAHPGLCARALSQPPRYEHEPVRPWVVPYVRHFQIPMAIVAALRLLPPRVPWRAPPGWVRGLFLASVIAYFTFLPAFAQSPQESIPSPD